MHKKAILHQIDRKTRTVGKNATAEIRAPASLKNDSKNGRTCTRQPSRHNCFETMFNRRFLLFSNLGEILLIQGNLRYTRYLLRPNFGRDWNRAYLLEIPLSMRESG